MTKKRFILKVNCLDEKGIVARITTSLFDMGNMIISLEQFSDPETKRFFMRLEFESESTQNSLTESLNPVFKQFNGKCELIDREKKIRLLIMCSKPDHCLVDLLAKTKRGSLPVEIAAVASNHETLKCLSEYHNIPFHYLPVTKETKLKQEAQISELHKKYNTDYIILARYMQVLSEGFCEVHSGKIINIHHSFLPSFKGASPYKQAHDRGVKIIGATAHFVTKDLDEGPIICQDIIRVNHTQTANDFARQGADIESLVLSRATKAIADYRVFLNGHKTIVLKS